MTDESAQADGTKTVTVMVCRKCGPAVIENGQPKDRCPKCGDPATIRAIDVSLEKPGQALTAIMPAPVMATIAARSIKQLLEDGERTAAWDVLCRAWRTCFELVLQDVAIKHQRGPVGASVLLLREYFNHRGDWQEAVECQGLASMLAQATRTIDPDKLTATIDDSVRKTVANAKEGYFSV